LKNIWKYRRRRTKFRKLSMFGDSPAGRMYYPHCVKSFQAPHGSEIRHGFRLMTQYASALKPEKKFLELRITVGYERNSLKETIIVEVAGDSDLLPPELLASR